MKMMIKLTMTVAACAWLGASSLIAAPAKPNIVHFLIDDLGWQDIACYRAGESIYETPNIDRIAANGMRFTQAYSPAPTCAPSRVAYMAGQWPTHTGVYHVQGGVPARAYHPSSARIPPFYAARLPVDAPNIAQMLKQAGYMTGHIQKWHSGGRSAGYPGPADYGFDFGWDGDREYNDPDLWPPENPKHKREYLAGIWASMRPNRLADFPTYDAADPYRMDPDDDDRPFDGGVDLAVKWLDKSKAQPFFLNYATFMVHGPIGTRDRKRLEYYCDKMGVPFPEDPGSIDKGGFGQKNPYYAAMVDSMDWMVGKVITYLEETDDPRNPGHKLIDNTYIILSSDNGGVTGSPAVNTAGVREHEQVTDNTPLRGGKQTPQEGGLRIPLIVKGPGIQTAKVNDSIVSLIDLLPTFMDMAGMPAQPALELDGCNLLPLFKGQAKAALLADGSVRDTLYFHYPIINPLASAIRKGDWKLILNYAPEANGGKEATLYRLQNDDGSFADLGEATDLADRYPEIRDDLLNDLGAHLADYDAAIPYKNPANPGGIHAHADEVPKVLRKYSVGDQLTVHFEAGVGKAQIVDAKLIYTTNGSDYLRKSRNFEEWFEAPAEVRGGTAVATAPPGMTHAIFYLRDANGFLITTETLPAETEVGQIYKITPTFADAFAYRPGLVAMIQCGESAVRHALVAEQNVSALSDALAIGRTTLQTDVAEEPYAKAIRQIRKEIRAFKGVVVEASLPELNQYRLKDW